MTGLAEQFRTWRFLHPTAFRRATGALMALSCCLAATGAYALIRSRQSGCGGWLRPPCQSCCQGCPGLDAAISARDAGQYDRVTSLTKSALAGHVTPECWQNFQAEFDRDLSVKFRLKFLPHHRGAPQPAGRGPLQLSAADPYYLEVNPSAKSYLYLFQIDGAGRLTAIFPNEKSTLARNPLPPGEQRIPENRFLRVSGQPGREQLFLVAANWEIPELKQIAHEAATANDGARRALGRRFQERASNEKKFAKPLRPGLAFGQWDIESLGAAAAAAKE